MRIRAQVKKTVTVDGHTATFVFTERDGPRWVSGKWHPGVNGGRGWTSRGYWESTQRDFIKKPRIHVDTSGETLLDNLANRTTRPVNVWGRAVRDALTALGLPGRIGWSQRAGCSCPCSPGFIWTDAPDVDFGAESRIGRPHTRYDVWVTLEDVPVTRDDDDAQAEQLGRLGALSQDPTLPLELLVNTVL